MSILTEEEARPTPSTRDAERLSRARLTEEVKSRARALGFQKVGVVRAESLTGERARLEEWLARGHHAGMSWMARDVARRTDPRELLAGARSVVVVALNYFTPHEHAREKGTGKISRYAWGDDYHDVLGERLRALLDSIKELAPGVQGKVCVDAQPAMDKAWAVRAGLGWIGKHTNLITREYGSWVFLGELILDAELAYDAERVEDHCGTCTLCLEACPTAAIVEPYVVDSALCISHATIELRDAELPPAVAPDLEGWLYGCDTCQDVCPWNRFEQPSNEPRFEPRPGNVSPALEDIVNLTHDAYVERFRRSPVKRAKLSGLRRNARALMGVAESKEGDE
ncbi:MAG TPA: tRNA epoxyqueuosine(34) reductase QueG [Pyrinomonadaceae bacterium]|nr:tRNA epoxyqueuosine(34) reductase QueG [Pyrinomonadaceae bacterium]